MQELSWKIDYKNFTTKASGSINFITFKGPFRLFKKIRDGEISIEMAEEGQEKFKRKFSQIKLGNPKHKSEMQLYTIRNVKNLYDSRQKIIDLLNNYSKIKSESIYRSKHDETKARGLKIPAPKQMLQKLSIALAQVKTDNNSESLLNEIRQLPILFISQNKSLKKCTTT